MIRGSHIQLRPRRALHHTVKTIGREQFRYTRHPQCYGYIYPVQRQRQETRIVRRIHARRITLDAIHK
jgi:hypothetical protein